MADYYAEFSGNVSKFFNCLSFFSNEKNYKITMIQQEMDWDEPDSFVREELMHLFDKLQRKNIFPDSNIAPKTTFELICLLYEYKDLVLKVTDVINQESLDLVSYEIELVYKKTPQMVSRLEKEESSQLWIYSIIMLGLVLLFLFIRAQ